MNSLFASRFLLESTVFFSRIHYLSRDFTMNTLSISEFHYEFNIYISGIHFDLIPLSQNHYPTIPKSLSQNHYEYTIFSRIQYEFTIQFAYRPKMHYVFAKSVKSHYLFRDYLMNSLSYTIFIDFSNWIREITMISLSASGFILNLLSVSRIP